MTNWKTGIIIWFVWALLLFGFYLFNSNKAHLLSNQHKIDSLSNKIVQLDSFHFKQDSLILSYKNKVDIVDKLIEVEKTKYVTLKIKFDEIRTRVSHYTPSQLDSFFSARYSDSSISNSK
jgi:hypothetical protein